MVSGDHRRGRDQYRWFTRLAMRWSDNDAYGHVNNTIYYQWFDTAVNSWLIEAGLLDIEKGDPIGLVVETGCTYFAPLSFPGEVDIGIALQRLGRSSVTYRICVFGKGDSEPSAEGHFTHVHVGRTDRRPVPVPDGWRSKLEELA